MHQFVIFVKPRKFDTADIKCFTVFDNLTGSGHMTSYNVILTSCVSRAVKGVMKHENLSSNERIQ